MRIKRSLRAAKQVLAASRPRATRATLAAVALAAIALGAGSPSPALATPGGSGYDTGGARARNGHQPALAVSDQSTLTKRIPGPPRPPTARPIARVVGKSGSGSTNALSTNALSATASAATGGGLTSGASARTLVLYDTTGAYGWLGEVYATLTANLASHFGTWTAHPVNAYTAGELTAYTAVIYVGSTYDEPLPTAFLDDVLSTSRPVLWMYDNIWQLTARSPSFAADRGFMWQQFDFASVAEVRYRGTSLTRDASNAAGLMNTVVTDPTRASVVAQAVRSDGGVLPWAVRSGNLTYLSEVPYSYLTHDDRYLAAADLLFDILAPTTVARHRALVRIEDVGPDSDPTELRAIADYLYSRKVPFTVAVYPRYRNPKGVGTNGVAQDYTLRKKPAVVSALKYMQARGGTLLMHGYTHQYSNVSNPYDAVSGNDFEFYLAHVDAQNNVIYDGPVANDSAAMVTSRVTAASNEFALAGLGRPSIFEFPHYAASAVDYQTVRGLFSSRYDRGLYYPGVLSGGTVDQTRIVGQFFPYAVRDVYGSLVVPENLGNVEPEAYNNHPARFPAELVASARRNLVVRDGMASFFYHPYLGTTYLSQVVEGIQALGYTFVAPTATLTQ